MNTNGYRRAVGGMLRRVMKARVYHSDPWWYGEVYADWAPGSRGWRDVTGNHFTKLGATIALKIWLRKHKTYGVEV